MHTPLQPRSGRRLVTFLALAAVAAVPVLAQRGPDMPRQPRGEAVIERLAERLDLTDEQRAAVREVVPVDDTSRGRGDLWQVAAVLHERLDTAQKQKLFGDAQTAVAYRRGMQAGMRRQRAMNRQPATRPMRRAGAQAPAPVVRDQVLRNMQAALGLTDDQVEIFRIHQALASVAGARVGMRAARMSREGGPARRMRQMR